MMTYGRTNEILIFLFAMCSTSCGQISDSIAASSESSSSVKNGTYSFVYTDPSFTCTDGSSGTAQGGSMQMTFDVSGGLINMGQSGSSAASSQQKAASAGTRVISASAMSGTINTNGTFVATSSALLDDPKFGYLRVSYKIDGKITGSSWSGKYDFTVFAEELSVTCTYRSTFSGRSAY